MSGNGDIKYNGKIFAEACKKAGLKVNSKSRKQVASGLVIRDGKGQRYTIDSEGQIRKTTSMYHIDKRAIDAVMLKRLKATSVTKKRTSPKLSLFGRTLAKKKRIKAQDD